ncbi:MAG: S-layer homology domain-containing protein, partial [Bacillota bacterium]|nr:S-layer homology domain-containing protein [Bacillota bacterium]
VGNKDFSAAEAGNISMVIDSSGTPYVAYMDGGNSGKATVMKYDGSNWVAVGDTGFSSGEAYYMKMAMDNNGVLYVAYMDGGNSKKATVMKYDGGSWVTVGNAGFSSGYSDYIAIAIDNSNTPYVAYKDSENSNKATVMKAIKYAIKPIAGKTFNELWEGYESGIQKIKTITIEKTGTGDIENLQVALSGANADAFDIDHPLSATLNDTTQSTTFTVKAKDGLAAGDYLADVTITADNITPAVFQVEQTVNDNIELTVTGITAASKTYDGNASADINLDNAQLVGIQGIDEVTLDTSNAIGTFENKNAGTGKTVTISGLALQGSNAKKYSLASVYVTADITPKTLIPGAIAKDKVHDGDTSAKVNITLDGIIGKDDVTASGTAEFSDSKVGENKTVTVTGIALAGADKGNYVLSDTKVDTTATIKEKKSSASSFGSTVKNESVIYHMPYIKGYSDNTFKPDSNITRAEAATILAGVSDSYNEYLYYTSDFNDLEPGGWYLNAIGFAGQSGLIKGYADGNFHPNANMTRAEFAAAIVRLKKLAIKSTTDDLFSDIHEHWAKDYIMTLYAQGWIKGYEDQAFKPDAYITRAEAVKIINAAIGRTPSADKVDANIAKYSNSFSDVSNTSWAYYEIMEATIKHKAADF